MTDSKNSTIQPNHPYWGLKFQNDGDDRFNAVIESPKGSRSKYKLNEERGFFELHKVLPTGLHFPLDFGFIPGTRADDGDPLDVLVFMDEPTFTGCLARVRLIGAITAEQCDKGAQHWMRNDRLLAVSVVAHRHRNLKSIDHVDSDYLSELEQFFVFYNSMQGKQFRIIGRVDQASAILLVHNAAAQ